MYREISPEKLRAVRGTRSLRQVAKLTGGALSAAALFQYEKGQHKPGRNQIAHLLKVYGVTYEDISEPVELIAA